MVRASRNYPSVYFGRPGALVTLPWPRGEISKAFDRPVFDFETGAGEHRISTLVSGSREFTLSWNALHVDNYSLLEQYWTGMMGQGPWAFIDPSQTNMLRLNQSSATNVYRDNRHFTVNLGGILSNATGGDIHRVGATRNAEWLFSSAPGATTPTLSLNPPYRSWYGFPAVPGLPYTVSSWIKTPSASTDASITLAVKLAWLNAAGSQISQLSDGDTAVTTVWVQRTIGGVAPAGTAYAKPTWVVTGSSVAAGGAIVLDELMLEQDSVVNPWAPGTGLRPVEILDFSDNAPFDGRFRTGVSMTLRELAA